jgi:hypothetical protein
VDDPVSPPVVSGDEAALDARRDPFLGLLEDLAARI